MVMQYADVKATYPARMTGRAMAVFTMAMFLGVALMQWLTGLVATAAGSLGVELYAAVLGAIGGLPGAISRAVRGRPQVAAAGVRPFWLGLLAANYVVSLLDAYDDAVRTKRE